jgi:hypothetical protein
MSPDLLPPPTSQPLHVRPFRRVRSFIRANGRLKTTVLFSTFISACLLLYTALSSSPSGRSWRKPFDWDSRPHFPPEHSNLSDPPYPSTSPDTSPLQNLIPEALSLEQIRDIVAPTRGYFSRDFSLGLGWNNVSIRDVPFGATLNVSLIDAVYHRCCRPPSRIAQSHVGSPFVRLCTRLRVPYVCESFPCFQFQAYDIFWLSCAATSVRTLRPWSTKAMP